MDLTTGLVLQELRCPPFGENVEDREHASASDSSTKICWHRKILTNEYARLVQKIG